MINFYIENAFIITVFIIGSIVVLPVLTILILRKNNIALKDRPDIEKLVTYTMFVLLVAGFIIPLIIIVLLKISPDAILNLAPFSMYFISFFIACFIFINMKRFKAMERKTRYKNNNDLDRIEAVENEIQEHEGGLIVLIIFILYFAILFSLKI